MRGRWTARRLLLSLGGAGVISGAAVLLPTATITVRVPMTAVSTQLETGVADAQFRPAVPSTLVKSSEHAVTRSVPVTQQRQAAYATGTVDVAFWGHPCNLLGTCFDPNDSMTLPAGAVVATCTSQPAPPQHCATPGQRFTVLEAVTLTPSHFTATVPVRAVEAGAAGNVPPNHVNVLVSPAGAADHLTIDNHDYIRGGTDANVLAPDPDALRTTTSAASIVAAEQADADLTAMLADRRLTAVGPVQHQTTAQTDGVHTGAASTSLRVAVRSSVLAADATALRSAALDAVAKVTPPGQYLVPDSLTLSPSPSGALGGRVIVHLSARLARIDAAALRPASTAHWTGGDVDALRERFGAANVELSQWPLPLPYLPLIGGRVTIKLEPLGDV